MTPNWLRTLLANSSTRTKKPTTKLRIAELEERAVPAAGDLDLTFGGGDGIVTYNYQGNQDSGSDVVVDGSGNVVVAGAVRNTNVTLYDDLALLKFTPAGVLDLTFGGGDGVATLNLDQFDGGNAVAIDGSGNYVVAGTFGGGMVVARFTPAGVLDTSFNAVGYVTFAGNNGGLVDMKIDGSGSIVVSFFAPSGGFAFGLARITSAGVLDPSFGTGGIVTTDVFAGDDLPGEIIVEGSGYLVSGTFTYGNNAIRDFGLVKYTATGTLDTTFGGGDGIAVANFGFGDTAYASIKSGTGYVLAGNANNNFALAKFDANGTLDAGFGTGGLLTTDLGGNEEARDVAVDINGNVVAYGYTGSPRDLALVRYTPAGVIDTTFGGGDGIVTTNILGGDSSSRITIDSSNRYVVTGYVDGTNGGDIPVVRYLGTAAATLSAALDGSNNLVITDTDGTGKNNNLTISNDGAGNIVITDTTEQFAGTGGIAGAVLSNGNKTITVPIASITGTQIIVNTTLGNDVLTANLANSLGKTLVYNGGTGGNDSLTLTGGTTTTVTHSFTNNNDGSVTLAGAVAGTINYTGLEPITDNMSATDRVFTFNAAAETITVTDNIAADGMTRIDSDIGGESVYFTNPTSSLTINPNSGVDNVTITSVDSTYRAATIINTGGDDNVTLNTALTLGSATSSGNFTIANANQVNLNANINTDGGLVAGNINITGPVRLGANVALDTDATNLDGTVTVVGPVNADAAGNNRTLQVIAGSTAVSFSGGNIGSTAALQTLTITSAGTVALPQVTTRSGGIAVTSTGTITLNGNLSTDSLTTAGPVTISGPVGLGAPVTIDTDAATTDAAITFATGSTINNPQPLTLNAGGGNVTLNNTAIGSGVPLTTLSMTGADVNGSGNITTTGGVTVTNTGTTSALGGVIGGAGATLTKSGTGTLALSAVNTFTGAVNVNAGTLRHSSGAATIGNTITIASGATLDGASVFGQLLTYSGTILNNGSITRTANGGSTFSNVISGSGSVANGAAGNMTLNGNNTFTGGVTQSGDGSGANTLTLGHVGALGTGTFTIASAGAVQSSVANLVNANNNAILLNSNLTVGGANSFNLGTGGVTLSGNRTINVTNTATRLTLGGAIGETGGARTLTKAGTGTLALTGASTYTGTTSVNAGTMLINGSVTSPVVVTTPGILGGSGTVTGNVSGTGTVAPGNSPGIMTINGNFTPTGTVALEVNPPSVTPGVDHDQLIVNGVLDLSGAALSFTGSAGAVAANQQVNLILNDLAEVTGAATNFANGATVTIGANTYRIYYNGGDGNDVVLVEATTPPVVYVDDNFSGTTGTLIADADLGTTGAQPATFGVNAFNTLAAAITNSATNAAIIVNGGTYAETVALTGTRSLEVTGPDAAQSVVIRSLTTAAGQPVTIEGSSLLTLGDATNPSMTLAGTVGGSGVLIKNGTGTLTLSGANTYAGGTTANNGTLLLTANTAAGTGAITVNTSTGGAGVTGTRVALQGGITVANALSLPSNSVGDLRSNLFANSGANTYSGLITLNGTGGIAVAGAASTSINITGGITGPTYTGGFVIARGIAGYTTNVNGVVNLPLASLTVTDGATATINVPGHSWTNTNVSSGILNIAGTGNINGTTGSVILGQSASTGTLNVTAAGAVQLGAANVNIGNTGTGVLNITGGGTVTIPGAITDTGTSTVNVDRGTLTIGTGLATDNLRVGFSNATPGVATTNAVTAALNLTTGTATIGAGGANNVQVGRRDGNGNNNDNVTGTLNLAGASSVVINTTSAVNVGTINASSGGGGTVIGNVTLSTAGTNTITTPTLTVSSSPAAGNTGAPGSFINLGNSTNTLNVNTLNVANEKGRATVQFQGSGGTLQLNGTSGIATPTTLNIGTNVAASTGTVSLGLLNTTNGTFNANLGAVILGRHHSGSGGGQGTLTMTAGTVTATSLTLGDSDFGGASTADNLTTGTLNLNGGTFSVLGTITDGDADGTAGGGSSAATINLNAGTLRFNTFSRSTATNSTVINFNSGTIQNNAGQALNVTNAPINLSGAGPRTIDVPTGLTATMQAASTIVGPGGFDKTGAGLLVLAGANSYAGVTNVNAGTLFVNGANNGTGAVNVNNDATLGGTGSIAGPVNTFSTSNIAPGTSPETLATGPLTLLAGTDFDVEINGTSPGNGVTGYDQLIVTGAVNLGGATLNLAQLGGYNPTSPTAQGDNFIIIDNDGTGDGVTGTFAGLPQGAVIPTFANFFGSGLTAYIVYDGGDGNDVEIIINTAPTFTLTPDTISENDVADVTVQITDPEDPALTTYSVEVYWNEDTPNVITLDGDTDSAGTAGVAPGYTDYVWTAATKTLVVSHQYLDDNPTNTASDSNTVRVRVADNYMTGNFAVAANPNNYTQGTTTVTVNNVAPTATPSVLPIPPGYLPVIVRNSPFTYRLANIVDPGTEDTFSITWNFGDGSPTVVQSGITQAMAAGPFDATYDFPNVGVFTVSMTLRDDDTGTNVYTYLQDVRVVAVINDELHIGGTDGNNNITIDHGVSPNPGSQNLRVYVDGLYYGTYGPTAGPGITDTFGGPVRVFAGDGVADIVNIIGTSGSDVFTIDDDVLPPPPPPVLDAPLTHDKSFSVNGRTFTTRNSESYFLKGLDGDDQFIVSGLGLTTVPTTTRNVTIEGSTGNDWIELAPGLTGPELGANGAADWVLEGPERGVLEGVLRFNTVAAIVSNDEPDNMVVNTGGQMFGTATPLQSAINFNGGDNVLSFAGQTGGQVFTMGTGGAVTTSAGIVQGVDTLIGTAGRDRLIGATQAVPATPNTWDITGANAGTYTSDGLPLVFSNMESLTGGGGNDDFNLTAAGSLAGNVDGAAGNDTLSYSTRTTGVVGTNIGTSKTTSVTGTFAGFETIVGGGGTSVNTLTASNTANTWNVTGDNDGTLNALNFVDYGTLMGGTGIDNFVLGANGLADSVNGGTGNDVLSFAGAAGPVNVTLNPTVATGTAARLSAPALTLLFSSIESHVGSTSGADTFTTTPSGDTILISGLNSGKVNTTIAFSGYESLVGGGGNDTYTVQTGGTVTSIDAAGGTADTLIGPNQANTWVFGAASRTLNGISFVGIEKLTGGSSTDSFTLTGGLTAASISGGSGNDTIDFGAGATVNLTSATAGSMAALVTSFSSIEGLVSSAGTLNGPNITSTWRLTGLDQGTLNTLTKFTGFGTINASNTATDRLYVATGGLSGSFNAGTGTGDILDYSGVTTIVRPYTVSGGTLASGTVFDGMGGNLTITGFNGIAGNL